jgi:hypothetical protein
LSRGHIDEYFKRYKAAELQYKKSNTIGSKRVIKLASLYKNKMRDPEKAKTILETYNNKGQD